MLFQYLRYVAIPISFKGILHSKALKLRDEKSLTTLEDAYKIAIHVQNIIIKLTGAVSLVVHTESA
jgi:hypothetical protein